MKNISTEIIKVRPFLRWAGGKTWLLKNLNQFLPTDGYDNFHEPFVGGGAIYFFLKPTNKAFLSDLNPELIDTYNCVKDDIDNVIKELKQFKNTKTEYYNIRDKKYTNSAKKAARFIYLNQFSFNGIYRVNLNGEYNVPYGFRREHQIDYGNLKIASSALKNCDISTGDFSSVTDRVKRNDLVFLDPPYTVTHNNNGFIKYNQKIFSIDDQYRLAKTINEIKEIGAHYILTNAAHNEIIKIFKGKDDKMVEIKRASLIGGKNAVRGKYAELIITNK
jgi:DNA adenine methylase